MIDCAKRLGRSRTLFPLALFLGIIAFENTAHADTITLTGGQVVLNASSRVLTVDLIGPNFILHSFDDFSFSQTLNHYLTCTIGCGTDGIGRVTFNAFTVSAFQGSGSFTESIITGSVTLLGNFDASLGQPPFPITINYVGTGVLSNTSTSTIFTVSAPVAEPGTILLLGTGLAGTIATVRRRRRTKPT